MKAEKNKYLLILPIKIIAISFKKWKEVWSEKNYLLLFNF